MTNEEFVEEYQKGNEAAFNELLERNKGIIYHMVNRWFQYVKAKKITDEELEAECIHGFWLAVKDFKIDSDVLFSTCAFNRIQWHLGKMLNYKTKKTSTGEAVQIVSFDDIVPGTDNLTYEDMIPDEETEQMIQNIFNDCDQQSLHDDLMQLLDELLSEKEKQIIIMHYGIGCKQLSQADIGKRLGISDTRIGQMESIAMTKLQSSPITACFANKHDRSCMKVNKQHIRKNIQPTKENISSALNFFGI